ncbi:hypothetical protein OQJ18_00815 [Fluoribacter dumoffii]|uniref:hypothetical protein n=1 Tax=Fluoribacter dumoffii TaxID=463 RepID=UPI0015593E20|nr:hypothetical protein [Fluoribacter dumoffii]MCW8386288.1 hypothetical protein [Fluoribacter dumoffii]MCW8419341.1 hypothetical protein [Fluoribacter dumoffii]MCW8452784.1 hypothetical protein [Fluoribacter dumoffii]MCW8459966.1 hypothetical protein [Fluoribacter dumoffii]MCW8483444.1 hypothetical protein [Fluoribacter dumoffii]
MDNRKWLERKNTKYPIKSIAFTHTAMSTTNSMHKFSIKGKTLSPANLASRRIKDQTVLITDILAATSASNCFRASIIFS